MKKTTFTVFEKLTLKFILLCCLFFTAAAPGANAQCSLAFNDGMNLSLDDQDCEIEVTVDMVADVSGCPGGDFSIIITAPDGTQLPSETITGEYAGMTLEVVVLDNNSGNSTWGYVNVEDKLAPIIDCTPPTGPFYCYNVMTFAPSATDACGVATVIPITPDIIDVNTCDGTYSDNVLYSITRRFVAVDESGNYSLDTCEFVFEVERIPDFSAIDIPDNYLLVEDNALDCDGDYPLDDNGNPSPLGVDGTGVPTFNGVDLYPDNFADCNLLITYEDTNLPPIGCTQKIMRSWRIIEWSCSSPQRDSSYIQMIEITDDEGPEIVCPVDEITASTNVHTCEATVLLPALEIEDNCSATYSVDITYPGGFLEDSNGGLVQLPAGENLVTYTAYDECLNSSSCVITVNVEDNTPPVVVCTSNTSVALTTNGYAWANVAVFDAGSYDECELESVMVKRMDDGMPCMNEDGDLFGEYVRFCCADVGEDVMVIVRATDANGNINDCMVSVEVQDKLSPTITCPADMTVNCDFAYDENDLGASFGYAEVQDNCGNAQPTESFTTDMNQCNVGTLTRTISVTDGSGTVSCEQVITFTPLDPFNGGVSDDQLDTDINWPLDVDLVGCSNPNSSDYDPENLPAGSQFPTFIEGACDLVGMNYDDEIFPFNNPNGDACFKIIRSWTVIDWCQFTEDNGVTYYPEWTWTQIIKVNDNEGPSFAEDNSESNVCTFDNTCTSGDITLQISATDNCTEALNWSYEIQTDTNGDGSFDLTQNIVNGTGNSIDASGNYPVGSHRVIYTFSDKCGNVVSRIHEFQINNCKAPTPYCYDGIAVDIMDNGDGTGMIDLWATDLDNGSSHPCGYPVYVSFDPVVFDQDNGNITLPDGRKILVNNGRTFGCAEVGENEVEVYAASVLGDSIVQAFCVATVDIQDNQNACDEMRVSIEGSISTASDVLLAEASVALQGSEMTNQMTNEEGFYAFPAMLPGGTYAVAPQKVDDFLNGVTTLDLVKIQRHLLELELFDDVYKVIASDINKDDNITASDLVQLRKLILGTIAELPSNGSWRFIDSAFEFEDESNPFSTPLPETYEIYNLDSDMAIDFVAVKVGDVTDNAVANLGQGESTTRSAGEVVFAASNKTLKTGVLTSIPVFVEDLTATGMQFTIELENVEFAGLSSDNISLTDENIGFSAMDKGMITVSWTSPTGAKLDADNALFNIDVVAYTNTNVENAVKINSTIVDAEAYNEDFDVLDINFEVEGRDVSANEFVMYQNAPNPFGTTTTISVDMPEAAQAKLTVFDVTGKIVTTVQQQMTKGNNQIVLDRSQLSGAGVMYYQLEAGQYFATKTMIMID